MHWADLRPAWLWSQDGSTLLWRNTAARYFYGKVKKSGLKLSGRCRADPRPGDPADPARRAVGRSSLSRVQFLAGDKPVATTCSCTPLAMPDGTLALLLVGVDPVAADVLEAAGALSDDRVTTSLLPDGAEYLVVDKGEVVRGSASAHAAEIAERGLPAESADVAVLKADPANATLVVYRSGSSTASIAEVRAEEGVGADEAAHEADDLASMPEPMLPLGLEAARRARTSFAARPTNGSIRCRRPRRTARCRRCSTGWPKTQRSTRR